MHVKKQLSEFAAAKLSPNYDNLNPPHIFLLPIGTEACRHQQTLSRHICNIWKMTDEDITPFGFCVQDTDFDFDVRTLADPGSWNHDEIGSINEEIDFQVRRVLQQMYTENILFSFVWADDLLAASAPDFLNLFHKWMSLNGGSFRRNILTVILPPWNSVAPDRLPDAFRLAKKCQKKNSDPLLCTHYRLPGSPLMSPAWPLDTEIYFLESSFFDPAGCLEDAAIMLGSHLRGSMFLPAFRPTTEAYEYALIRQILSCMDQLESTSDVRPASTPANMTNRIREHVSTVESTWEDFDAWMQHARVFRQKPISVQGNFPDLYGSWFRDLADEWRTRLLAKEPPEQLFLSWLDNCTPAQLEEFHNQLQNFARQPQTVNPRGTQTQSGNCTHWKDYLGSRLENELAVFYHNTLEERIQHLVQRMLTIVIARLQDSTAPKMDWRAIRTAFQQMQARAMQRIPYTPGNMNEDQRIRFLQQLQYAVSSNAANYQSLYALADELVRDSVGSDLNTWLKSACNIIPCCRHNYMLNLTGSYTECPQVVPSGTRSGQSLYLLQLNQSNSIQDSNLLFFANNLQDLGS